MNHSSSHTPAANLRVSPPSPGVSQDLQGRDHQGQHSRGRNPQVEIAAVVRICTDLLDAELQFYGSLESLLAEMATANLFSTEAAMSLQVQIGNLQRQRDAMSRDRILCQRALAAVIRRPAGEVRMSQLEPFLHAGDRAVFRKQRLETVGRVEGTQQLLRRVDVLLAGRQIVFADLIAALTGQSPSSHCYGANGRREGHLHVSVLEAVS